MMPSLAELRAEFPVTERLVYLDIANKASSPRCVLEAAREFFEAAWRDGGARSYSPDTVQEVRGQAARLLGATPEEIAFVKNTSEGLNAAIHALGLKPGDNVVTTTLDHANAVFALRNREPRGVEVRCVAIADADSATDRIVDAVDDRTRIVLTSHVTWAAGWRLDLAALSAACRPRGVRLVVDGVQAAGVIDVDVRRLGVDVYVASAHKGLLTVPGIGVLYCRRELIAEMSPVFAARASMAPGSALTTPLRFADDARRFEIGNPNYLGIHLLGRALDLIERAGIGAIEARVRDLTTSLIEGLERVGRRLRTPRPWSRRAGIVAFEDEQPEATAARLRREGIVLSARDGALRAAPYVYNTESELDYLLARFRA